MAQYAGLKANQATRAGVFANFVEVYVQVSGAATYFVGRTRGELETNAAIPPGLAFNQANTNPPFKLTWIGELWVLPNADGSVIEITPTIPPPANP